MSIARSQSLTPAASAAETPEACIVRLALWVGALRLFPRPGGPPSAAIVNNGRTLYNTS